jgi:hypothetical protein
VKNSARYKTPDGTKVHGVLEEGPSAVASHLGDDRPLFEVPYPSIEKIRLSFPSPNVMTIVRGTDKYALRLTGSLIDDEQHGSSDWVSTQSGETFHTREQSATQDAMILFVMFMKIVEWVAADRVRRRRVRNRILAHTNGSPDQ